MRLLVACCVVAAFTCACPPTLSTCNVDTDCDSDELCVDGECRLVVQVQVPAADAGVVVDAGRLVDAGFADAGSIADAGFVDAGIVDAGIVDAGFVDAGFVDAGSIADAGFVDAGFVDAGFVDVDSECPAFFEPFDGDAIDSTRWPQAFIDPGTAQSVAAGRLELFLAADAPTSSGFTGIKSDAALFDGKTLTGRLVTPPVDVDEA
ncbi:MAG TPA: hypothetical protein VGO62_19225, partial [Myxococcota bacterium]